MGRTGRILTLPTERHEEISDPDAAPDPSPLLIPEGWQRLARGTTPGKWRKKSNQPWRG